MSKTKTAITGGVIGTFIHYGILLWACLALWGEAAFWPLAALAVASLSITFGRAIR